MNVREWALPVYTILMQLATGSMLILWTIRASLSSKFSPKEIGQLVRNPILILIFTVITAMVGAHFHLSRPFISFLSVLNFRSSWLSREIVFSVLFFLAISGMWLLIRSKGDHARLISGMGWLAVLFGCILMYCMTRIYLLPTQAAWNSSNTLLSFFLTQLLLGMATIAFLMISDLKFAEVQNADDIDVRVRALRQLIAWLTPLIFVTVIASIAVTLFQVVLLQQGDLTARTSLRLLLELYLPLFILRLALLAFAPFNLGHAVCRMNKTKSPPQSLLVPLYFSCFLILVGEIIGRFLFYATHVRLGI